MAMQISLGSGATLATNLVNGEHLQVIAPVTIAPRTDYIGLVSISGNVNIPSGVTVNNFPATQTVAGTVNVGNLLSLASGQFIGLNPTANYIGLVSVQGNVNVSNFPAAGLVSLASGTEVRALATILNFPSVQQTMATLYPRTDYLGLVSVSGNVNIGNTPTVNVNGLTSLASGTEVRSLATILNFPATQNVQVTNLISLASGTFVSLNPGTNYIGLVSISGSITTTAGAVTLYPGPNQIGSVTVSNFPGVISLASGQEIRSLATIMNWPASQAITGNVGLNAGGNFIGLATVEIDRSTDILSTTNQSAMFISSASGTMQLVNLRGPSGNAIPDAVAAETLTNQRGLMVVNQAEVFNGSNWDRMRTANIANATTGVGLLGAGVLGFDGTNYYRLFSDLNGITKSLVTVNGNVTLGAGTNYIGLVSISGSITTTAGAVTLYPGPNQIGSVTVSNVVAVSESGTWNVGLNSSTNFIGLVSLASINGTVTITGNNGLVSNASVVTSYLDVMPLGQYGGGGKGSLASGSFHPLQVDSSGNLINGTGTSFIGLVSAASINGTVTNAAGTNYIGLASVNIGGTLPALTAGTNFIGLVSVQGNVNVSNTGLVSNATVATSFIDMIPLGQYGAGGKGSLASGAFHPLQIDSSGGLILGASANYIGLVSISGTVTATAGAVTLYPGPNQIGSVTISNNPTLGAGSNFIGLISAASINGTVTLAAGTNNIGFATVTPLPMSTYTSIASVISGSGNATLFTVPNGQRWILKDLIIGSMGQTNIQIQSEGRMMIPFIGLATYGGFISNFGEAGLAAASINGSFVVNNQSAVTISVTANVRFQST